MGSFVVSSLFAVLVHAEPFTGTWHHEATQVSLVQEGSHVTGELLNGEAKGAIEANILGGTAMGNFNVDGNYGVFMARPDGNALQVTLNGAAMSMQRGRRKRTSQPAPPVQAAVNQAPVRREPILDEGNGWRAQLPSGWGTAKAGIPLWARPRSGPGVIAVFYSAGVTESGTRQFLSGPISIGDVSIKPQGKPQSISIKGAKGFASNGSVDDGSRKLKARTVVVLREGDSVVITGMVEPEGFKTLTGDVDALAKSVEFTRPAAGRHAHLLDGSYKDLKKERGMRFDGQGGASWNVSASNLWVAPTATMDGVNAIIPGKSIPGRYQFDGKNIRVEWSDGDVTECVVDHTFANGIVRHLKCGNTMYYYTE